MNEWEDRAGMSDGSGNMSDSESSSSSSEESGMTHYRTVLDDRKPEKKALDPQETAKKLVSFIKQKSEYHILVQNEMDRLAKTFVKGVETAKKLASFVEHKGEYDAPVQKEFESLAATFVMLLEYMRNMCEEEHEEDFHSIIYKAHAHVRKANGKQSSVEPERADDEWKRTETTRKLVSYIVHRKEFSDNSAIQVHIESVTEVLVKDIEKAIKKSQKKKYNPIGEQETPAPASIKTESNQLAEDPATKTLTYFIEQKDKCHVLLQSEIEYFAENFLKGTEKAIELWESKCLPIIERKIPVPVHIRIRSEQLLEELEEQEGRRLTATKFVKEIQETMHTKVLRSHRHNAVLGYFINKGPAKGDVYFGLNSDRETEEEVENIIRLVPDAAYRQPGVFRCDSLQDVAFIPLLLRLRKEIFGNLRKSGCIDDELGGLVTELMDYDNTLLKVLVMTDIDIEDKELYDDRLLEVMRRLKDENILQKELVQKETLLLDLICESENYFPEKRFWFLVDWDPDALKRIRHKNVDDKESSSNSAGSSDNDSDNEEYSSDSEGDSLLPLRFAASLSNLRGFQLVFEAGIQYFPKIGMNLLFHTDEGGDTAYEVACKNYGRENTTKAIESALNNCSDKVYNTAEALVMAATDNSTSLDGIYFILRREPAALAKLHGEESPRIDGANEDASASCGNDDSRTNKKQKIS